MSGDDVLARFRAYLEGGELSPQRARKDDLDQRAARLRESRMHAKLTQDQLAKRIGVSRVRVAQLEKLSNEDGRRDGSGESQLSAWAEATGVSEYWLATGETRMAPKWHPDYLGELAADEAEHLYELRLRGLELLLEEKLCAVQLIPAAIYETCLQALTELRAGRASKGEAVEHIDRALDFLGRRIDSVDLMSSEILDLFQEE